MGFFCDRTRSLATSRRRCGGPAGLVVDTGIHAFGWNRERAIDYMVANTGHPRDMMTAEVDRYIVWPGQATAYKIGELGVRELRSKAKAELGDRFELRRFHNAVIDDGALPLQVLESQIEAWNAAPTTQGR